MSDGNNVVMTTSYPGNIEHNHSMGTAAIVNEVALPGEAVI